MRKGEAKETAWINVCKSTDPLIVALIEQIESILPRYIKHPFLFEHLYAIHRVERPAPHWQVRDARIKALSTMLETLEKLP